jgi:hypothetical protein
VDAQTQYVTVPTWACYEAQVHRHIWYHGSRKRLKPGDLVRGEFCVTDDPEAALAYGPYVHEVRLPGSLVLASERDVLHAAREIDEDQPYNQAWEAIEQLPGLKEALLAEGYEGAWFRDQTPALEEHDTIMLFDPTDFDIVLAEDD